jgi:predicted amidohydrolase
MKKYILMSLILTTILVFAFKAKLSAEFVEGDNFLILNGATLIDGTKNEPIPNAVVILEGKRILKIGKVGDYIYSSTAEVLQLDNKFVIPGLIDVKPYAYTRSYSYGKND